VQPWFVEFAEGINDGEPIYLACEECGQGALPPRTVCPECGTRTLEERSLSETATVTSSTQVFSSIPKFAEETPYTVVIATFDEGVQLTGQFRDAETIALGEAVTVDAEEHGEEEWLVTFLPTE